MYRFLRLAYIGITIGLSAFTTASQAQEDITNAGTIIAVDVHERTIQVNQKQLVLADNLQVFSPKGFLISQLLLAPGQKIQYTTSNQVQDYGTGSSLNAAITSIHIVSGYKESGIKQ